MLVHIGYIMFRTRDLRRVSKSIDGVKLEFYDGRVAHVHNRTMEEVRELLSAHETVAYFSETEDK